jgi:hypothetical protein
MRWAGIVVVFATAVCAQTSSSSNGWSFAETLRSSTDVVVADIVSGSGVDDGSLVTVRATVRVVRVLTGGLVPGAEVPLTWQYKPLLTQGPASTATVVNERGLWFLRREDGRMRPQQAAMDPTLGGYFLPAGAAPRYYGSGATLAQKVAAEIAPVMEELATQHGADLAPRAYAPTAPLTIPGWARTHTRFYSLLIALQNLDVAAKKEVYADFSASPNPYLQAIGISGRLESGDTSAYFDLEKNVLTVAPIYEQGGLPLGPMLGPVVNNMPAARALARLAVGETALPTLESSAAMQLAATHSPEFLPYLMVLLRSPNPSTRGTTLIAFCQLLRDGALWKPEMTEHCPNHSPVNDAAAELQYIRYWTSWWEANRGQSAAIAPPARYSIASPAPPMVPIPPEVRLLSLLGGQRDIVEKQLGEADRATYAAIVADTNAKLAANDKKAEQVMNAARIAGKLPERSQLQALNDERNAILKASLDELRRRLSPAGRQVLEKFLNTVGGVMARPL